jgi:hypothetical protein
VQHSWYFRGISAGHRISSNQFTNDLEEKLPE